MSGGDNSTLEEDKLFLGFDFSTQAIKAAVINDKLELIVEENVNFDTELPEYRTQNGAHLVGDRATAPTIMWVKGLDILMEKLRIAGVDFGKVAALSGDGQQHGSVYWRTGAKEMLASLDPDKFMHDQLAQAFSVLDSPIWMDSSTGEECQKLEEELGGPQKLTEITGSRAYRRFTGVQIAKIFKKIPEAYSHTSRISLVSSFACSLFLGDFAPIDLSDGGGMNLLDINKKDWDQECLDACAPDLRDKLGPPVRSSAVVGKVSSHMVERYGFDPGCDVVAFTGDNQASLAGMRMRPGDIGISLGTSDNLFVWIESDPKPQLVGHVWVNPVNCEQFMALLCYKNGSLTRERIRHTAAEGSWELFSQLLESTPRGNFGNIGMYYDNLEITPADVKGDFRFNKSGDCVARFASKEAEVRALVEGQFMAKRIHAESIGFVVDQNTRILATGGASVNKAILQVIADVFNAPVYTQDTPNSAALGSSFRARHGHLGGEKTVNFEDVNGDDDFHLVCSPHKDANAVYKTMLERFRGLEERITEHQAH